MPVPLLDLTAQYESLREDLDAAVARVAASQRFVLGPEVEALEDALSAYVGVPHAVAVGSGTDALLLPLRALRPGAGDEALVPAFTFFATAGAAWNAGFRLRFCDVDADTFNVTAESLADAWTERTRVVIPVHLFGQMAPMRGILDLAHERGTFVLEDAAQAIGARQGQGAGELRAGGAGTAGALSFFPTKNLGAYGDGGMVTTRDRDLAETVRKLRVHGGRQMYHHEFVGTNSRLDALQAAVLRVKLPHLDDWAAARRVHAGAYDAGLADVNEVTTPPRNEQDLHVYNQYTIRVPRRDELREFLAARGIGSGIYYPVPLHLQPCFADLGYGTGDFPVAERLCNEVLSLPVFPELGLDRVARVVTAIRTFYDG